MESPTKTYRPFNFKSNKPTKLSDQFDYVNRQFGFIIARLEQLAETGLNKAQMEHVDGALEGAYKARNALSRITISLLDLIPQTMDLQLEDEPPEESPRNGSLRH